MTVRQILIIDDEERIRELVQACLEDLGGWRTISAPSAREGLLKAETPSLDAILLDVSMPDMDGFLCFQKLQENPVTRSIPVVLLTAKVLSDDRVQFSQMGVAGMITKPFNPVTLCEQISEILGWSL